jgi:hypothetical protein
VYFSRSTKILGVVGGDITASVHAAGVARPEGFEPPTLCLEVMHYKTLSAASGVAYRGARHLSRL